MALFGTDYDRPYRRGPRDRGTSYWSRSREPLDTAYDRDYRSGRGTTGGRDSYSYDTEFRYGDDYSRGRGYDREYKSRWQTDYGDPYGDRVQQTPIRVIRGAPGEYDRPFRYGREPGDRYPMGYMPYSRRAGYDAGYRPSSERSYYSRGYGSAYDRDWL